MEKIKNILAASGRSLDPSKASPNDASNTLIGAIVVRNLRGFQQISSTLNLARQSEW